MRFPDSHYGHADRINRWARGAIAFAVFIAIGVAALVSALEDDATDVEVLSAQAGSFTSPSVTLAPQGDLVLGIPESTTTTRDVPTEAERTLSATSTSLDTTTTTALSTTSTSQPTTTTATTTSTSTLPPTTTTSSTTSTTTTTTSSTTTTLPNPDVPIFLKELKGSSESSADGWEATARVRIDTPKGGADLRSITVIGVWTGAFDADVSGQTNRQGLVTFNTPPLTSGTFITFRVKNIFHPEYFYDSDLNQADSVITITRG